MTINHDERIAFRLKLRTHNFTGNAAGTLFVVECEFCADRCGGYTDFPLVLARDFPDCSWKLKLGQRAPTMTWTSFEAVIQRARLLYQDEYLELVPNSSLGPIEIQPIGRWPKILDEIDLASPGGLLFAYTLISKLQGRGFNLPYQPITIRDSQGLDHNYGIMQPHVYRMLHPQTFIEFPNYRQCARCGTINILKPGGKSPSRLWLSSDFRGRTDHLFRVKGYEQSVFVSDALQQALCEIQPMGLILEPFGVWKV